MPRMTYWHRHLNDPEKEALPCAPVKTPHLEEQEDLRKQGYHQMVRSSMREHLRWFNRANGGIRTTADVPRVS